ncbi:MAG: hypothetical protein HFJ50_03675 [Clostridia bacterium]|jgi:hypothetical protein|nr:hypothetical protein [Clostridia bacterium]
MKFIGKHLKETGIVLIALIVVILIVLALIAIIVKGVFDAKSIGANRKRYNESR